MRPVEIRNRKIGHSRSLQLQLFLLAIMSLAMGSGKANAVDVTPSDYRITTAGAKYDGTRQYAVAFKMRPPRRLRARRLELALGSISSPRESSAFVSLGPVWHMPVAHRSLFVELGFSPTLISGSSFNGRDLGGHFHFTSSFAIGASFGRFDTVSVSFRAQHTSNGGLSETNPGIDMIGLNVSFNFSN